MKSLIKWLLLGLFAVLIIVIQFIPGEAPDSPPTPDTPRASDQP